MMLQTALVHFEHLRGLKVSCIGREKGSRSLAPSELAQSTSSLLMGWSLRQPGLYVTR